MQKVMNFYKKFRRDIIVMRIVFKDFKTKKTTIKPITYANKYSNCYLTGHWGRNCLFLDKHLKTATITIYASYSQKKNKKRNNLS